MPGLGLGITARRGGLSPAIAASLPSLDLDFLKQGYQMNLIGKAFSEIFTFSRASGGGRINASGVYEWVAANQPRFDYDPVTLQPKGILIEEQRTNRWTNSAWPGILFQSAVLSITTNYGATPISGVSSTRLVRTADGNATTFNFNSPGAAPASPQAPSVFFKLNSAQASLSVYAGNGNSTQGRYFNFSVSGGVITPTDGAIAQAMGNGFWRLSFPFTPGSAITGGANLVFVIPSGALDCELVGFQWEDGSFATSYIPTSGSQVTRAADVCLIKTLSPWFKTTEGCFVFEGEFGKGRWQVTGKTSYLDILGTDNSGINGFARNASGNIIVTSGQLPSTAKLAVSWGAAGSKVCVNGGTVQTGAGVPDFSSGTVVSIGRGFDAASYLNGHVRRLRFFQKQPSDAFHQSSTA